MKPRILIFSAAYLPLIGGAEVAVKEITDRLYNYDFDLITARFSTSVPARERIGNIQVYRIGVGVPLIDKLLLAMLGKFRAVKLCRQIPYQGAWAIMASYGGFAAACFSKAKNVPLLLTLQEGDPLEQIEKKVFGFKKYFSDIFRQAKILQAISFFLLQWGRQKGFVGDYGVVVPNGVDVTNFTKHFLKEEIDSVRSSFDFQPNSKICVTVSRLVEKNGVDTIIESLAYLPPEVCLVICGSGKLEKKLTALVKSKKLNSRVKFMGEIKHANLPLILKACHVFVRPSRSEGLGNAFLEAMAAGVVTIGTPVGGIPDFLKDGVTGFLTEPNNPTHLAKTIARVLALSAHEHHQLHEHALNLVKKQYNWDIIATEMNTLFIRLCDNSAKSQSV